MSTLFERKTPVRSSTLTDQSLADDEKRSDHQIQQRGNNLNRLIFALFLLSLLANGARIVHRLHRDNSYGLPVDVDLDAESWQRDLGFRSEERAVERNWEVKKPHREIQMPLIIDVEEVPECAVPRPVGICPMAPSERIHIVFVSAMWYREPNTQMETSNMVKSMVAQTRCKLWFHFMVAGEPEVNDIPTMMDKMGAWKMVPIQGTDDNPLPDRQLSPNGKIRGYVNNSIPRDPALLYSLHYIPTSWVLERAKGLGLYPLAHHAGVPGMSKFFMADILWQVKRAVYLDVDMLMAGDVQDLWTLFREFDADKTLLYYMGNNHPEGHNARRFLRPYCSCQLVLDLARIREVNMTQMIVAKLRGRAIKSLDVYVEDGDQFLFMWLCKMYKGSCRILPRMWNVSGCSKPVPFLGLKSHGKQVNESCWRVVHFNCIGHKKGRNGKYYIPKGWKDAFQWVNYLRLSDLQQPDDTRAWKTVEELKAI